MSRSLVLIVTIPRWGRLGSGLRVWRRRGAGACLVLVMAAFWPASASASNWASQTGPNLLGRDPFVQQGPKLTSGEADPAWFGSSVALSADGRTALVGAPMDSDGAGAVYVLARSSGVWTRVQRLTATGTIGPYGEQFGYSVALSADGKTALIGGVGDNELFGAAYVFTRSSDGWTQQAKLIPSDASTRGDPSVGGSVALSANGDTALVGGPNDDVGVGAAWVFTRSSGVWAQQGSKLTGRAPRTADFGASVALSADGDTALIGAPSWYNQTAGTWDGTAYVFIRSSGNWRQEGPRLIARDEVPGGNLGVGVALSSSGKTALVGAYLDGGVGAAFVFRPRFGMWTQSGPKLTARDETGDGEFGFSVALSSDGRAALIGGRNDNSQLGAAWVFTRRFGRWRQEQPKLTPSDETYQANLGQSVALSGTGTTALLGAPSDSNPSAGIFGSGAAWVFAR